MKICGHCLTACCTAPGRAQRFGFHDIVVCHDTLDFTQVPGFPSAIETRSLPTLTRSYPCHFTFYVA
jgi:hypothetical protein